MGGKIWVESEMGKGSVFHFSIELKVDRGSPVLAPTVVQFDGCRMLIVDDNAVNRTVLTRTLEAEGIITHAVASGPEALQWLSQGAFQGQACHLVLLDAQMPAMDGFATARHIHALPGCTDLAMVMLSSAGLKGDGQRATDAGILGYLTKPVARDELLQAVARILNMGSGPLQALVTAHSIREEQVLLNVLLVEDHAINQKLAITLLERWGHHVEVANNGLVALEILAGKQFDVILMDMMMPVMDGLEATRRIRANESLRRTPIIAMTANAMESDRERCLEAGMDDYISKPIKAQELRQMLQRLSSAQSLVSQTRPAPLTNTSVQSQVFDYAAAMQRVDQEVVSIISTAFVQQWPGEYKKIQDGLVSDDLQVVMHTAHALKGTLAMFGAAPASDLAYQLEQCSLRGDAVGAGELVPPLALELDRLIDAIQINGTQ
jgi:CheY-like chemotaxis protein/HPt (histidine-containing phosphotransfer) domain-containing protein